MLIIINIETKLHTRRNSHLYQDLNVEESYYIKVIYQRGKKGTPEHSQQNQKITLK